MGVWPADMPDVYWAITGDFAVTLDTETCSSVRSDLTLFYQYQLGEYPLMTEAEKRFGGIPQRANLESHLARAENDIVRRIPDPDYDGLAVIDYESWHPLWEHTHLIYKQASRAHALRQAPYLSGAELEEYASRQYEQSARVFMVETIRLAKSLRPRATWGYFGFPRLRADPEQMQWLFDEADAVFPVAYADWASDPEPDETMREAVLKRYPRMITRFMEHASIASRGTGRDIPIYPFLSLRYRPHAPVIGGRFVNYYDLVAMLNRTSELRANGIVLWDSIDTPELADAYDTYLRSMLAPAMSGE